MRAVVLVFSLLFVSLQARADDIVVMTSGAFTAALQQLVPVFEASSTHHIKMVFGASMGSGATTIPSRLARGERADIVILAASALDDLVKRGLVVPGSRVDLVRSRIAMAVRSGAAKPDISSVAALKATLLRARSVAYSSSASGVYLATELFPRLGVAEALKGKTQVSEGAVGPLVASGAADIGFQQVSELLPVPGIDMVGPLPPGAQRETIFSAGLAAGAQATDAARALVRFLTSSEAAPTIVKSGLDPVFDLK